MNTTPMHERCATPSDTQRHIGGKNCRGSWVPKWVTVKLAGDPAALGIYTLLVSWCSNDRRSMPKAGDVEDALGVTTPQLRRYLQRLVAAGVLGVEQTGDRCRPRIYHLPESPEMIGTECQLDTSYRAENAREDAQKMRAEGRETTRDTPPSTHVRVRARKHPSTPIRSDSRLRVESVLSLPRRIMQRASQAESLFDIGSDVGKKRVVRKPRKMEPDVYEAYQEILLVLAEAEGTSGGLGSLTRPAISRLGLAAKHLLEVGATPVEVETRVGVYKRIWQVPFSAGALVSHWDKFVPNIVPAVFAPQGSGLGARNQRMIDEVFDVLAAGRNA